MYSNFNDCCRRNERHSVYCIEPFVTFLTFFTVKNIFMLTLVFIVKENYRMKNKNSTKQVENDEKEESSVELPSKQTPVN